MKHHDRTTTTHPNNHPTSHNIMNGHQRSQLRTTQPPTACHHTTPTAMRATPPLWTKMTPHQCKRMPTDENECPPMKANAHQRKRTATNANDPPPAKTTPTNESDPPIFAKVVVVHVRLWTELPCCHLCWFGKVWILQTAHSYCSRGLGEQSQKLTVRGKPY